MSLLFSTTNSASAAPVILDDFSALTNIQILNATLATTPQQSVLDDASILGGERDIQIVVTAGAGTMTTNASDDSEYLTHSQPVGLRGRTIITWDGNDNDASVLSATGLGGINLQSPSNDAFVIGVVTADVLSRLTIQVFTDAGNSSTGSVNVPAGTNQTTFLIPFSSFSITSGTGADFTNVGAVQMTINSAATPTASLDMVIDFTVAGESSAYRDFGDLPDTYGTLLGSNGPRHTTSNLFLGSSVDNESDATPTGDASGDGIDESGVSTVGIWTNGAGGGSISAFVTGDTTACLSGWVDFNNNGDFADAGEQILDMIAVTAGANPITFDVPSGTFSGNSGDPDVILNARFRLAPDVFSDSDCSVGDEALLASTGAYVNGEVEDYQWTFSPTAVTLTNLSIRNNTPFWVAGLAGILLMGGALLFLRLRKTKTI